MSPADFCMEFADVICKINRCGRDEVRPGLERMQEACERLGHPECVLRCVHVAGTNGKGSTLAFLESLLRALGCSVGRYTSPHLYDLRERICINGQIISESQFVSAYTQVSDTCSDLGLSYFEWLTLMGFIHFRDQPVDIVLLETGLGGRWDATNVVTPLVSVITTIDYDHQDYLGNTLSMIAAEKSGILKLNVPAVIAPQKSEAMDVIQNTISELGIHGQVVPPLSSEIQLGLEGEHQRQNAALAVAAVRVLCGLGSIKKMPQGCIDLGPLATVCWPGRLQWVSQNPAVLCDVAHNPSGMRVLVDYLMSSHHKTKGANKEDITILLGVMSDKDAINMVKILAEISNTFFCITPKTPRALPSESLAKIVNAAGCTAVVSTIEDVRSRWNGTGTLVVTGSFYTVGEFCEDGGFCRFSTR